MTSNTLYIYERTNKKGKKVTTYSLTQNPALGTLIGTAYRLIADPGKVLTDGRQMVTVIDTADPSQWQEIDEPKPEPEPEPEVETNE